MGAQFPALEKFGSGGCCNSSTILHGAMQTGLVCLVNEGKKSTESGLTLRLHYCPSKLPFGTQGIHMPLIWGAYDLLLSRPARKSERRGNVAQTA